MVIKPHAKASMLGGAHWKNKISGADLEFSVFLDIFVQPILCPSRQIGDFYGLFIFKRQDVVD